MATTLSALVVKAAFYLVLRLWLDVFADAVTTAAAAVLGVLGAGAVLWGSWRALQAERLKLLAAYSTVAQLGYLFLFFPLLLALPPGPARDLAAGGLVMLVLTHGFAKAGLFLAIGVIQQRSGNDNIADLDGTVATEVEEDDAVTIPDGAHGPSVTVDDEGRQVLIDHPGIFGPVGFDGFPAGSKASSFSTDMGLPAFRHHVPIGFIAIHGDLHPAPSGSDGKIHPVFPVKIG